MFARIIFMANILIVSKNENLLNILSGLFMEHGLYCTVYPYNSEEETFNYIKENDFSIILIDDEITPTGTYSVLAKKIKNYDYENNVFTVLLYNPTAINNTNEDLSGFIDAFVQKPVIGNILIPTINSCLKIKRNIDKYKEDNKELNKSLYQLDVMYNTSSKLSGNLDKEKLYEIMFETLEKTLSFDFACALIHNNRQEQNRLIIHSLKKPDETTLNILKEKIINIARENNNNADFSNIKIEEHIKPSYLNQSYDIKLLNFDKLAAPIKAKDKTFGTLLIYRHTPFTKEDVVCFQSVVHQISSSLRTIILYNEIKNANIELKKLEKIKSEFVSIVSHELRTPLTPINLSLEILLSEKLNETQQNSINMAKRNVARLSGIIEDLLDLSRIQTGKFDFKYKKYNIKSSLDLIQKTFENQAKEKSVEFYTDFSNPMPEIYADSRRIEQILSNLVTNAIKFTPKDGKIEISAKTIPAAEINKNVLITPVNAIQNNKEEYIQVSVKDTGIGIKEEDIYKIFDKFSQIENSLTRNAGGVGLGLTISKHFIDAHLGGIFVTSKENKGSNFNVLIPVFSEDKAFEIDLNTSKKLNDTTCMIKIKTNNELQNKDFINLLKQENIIKPVKNFKEITIVDNDLFVYKAFFPALQKGPFELMTDRIQNAIKSAKECGIVLEKTIFKKEDEAF